MNRVDKDRVRGTESDLVVGSWPLYHHDRCVPYKDRF